MQADQAADILLQRYPNLVSQADRKPLIRLIEQSDWFRDVTTENDLIGKHLHVLEVIIAHPAFQTNEVITGRATTYERMWKESQ